MTSPSDPGECGLFAQVEINGSDLFIETGLRIDRYKRPRRRRLVRKIDSDDDDDDDYNPEKDIVPGDDEDMGLFGTVALSHHRWSAFGRCEL